MAHPKQRPTPPTRRAAGMALIAVLWIVAALSLMVMGLSGTVRQQIQIIGSQRDQVSGQAAGEAAIALALQALQVAPERPAGTSTLSLPYGGLDIGVELAPLNGLISLNDAGAALLAALLQNAGGLDAGRAQALAGELVVWRDGRPDVDPTAPGAASVQARRFEAVEDLMLVPGVDYALYARVAPLLSADLRGGQINPLAAPPAVQAVLTASGLSSPSAGGVRTDLYRLQASVPLETGKILLLTRDVALGIDTSRKAPWSVLRTDRQIVAPPG